MRNVEDTTADYLFKIRAMAISAGEDNKEYNAKLMGLLETYHIICISVDVMFNESMDNFCDRF